MSSPETPILSADAGQEEENLRIEPQSKEYWTLIIAIIWCLIAGGSFISSFTIYKRHFFSITSGIFLLIGISIFFKIGNGAELTINNINRTLTLKKKKLINICKNSPRIIDLNQIEKISINSRFNFGDSGYTDFYMITYKNGTFEDLSSYFKGCNQQSFVDSQNLFKKYLKVDDANPQNPQLANNNQNQNYNPNVAPGYNPNIAPNYYQNGYNSGMAQGIPQNYNQQGYNMNVNNNYVAGYDQNAPPIQQNLPTENEICKPAATNLGDGTQNV